MGKPDGIRVRRGIAVGTAVVLVLEAVAIALVNWILGIAVKKQEMSLGGMNTDAMAVGSWAGGGLFALFLLTCAVLATRIALRDRMSGRAGRIALIVCAVVHGVVGALVVGLVGWYAFVLMMVILGLLVGTLLLYAPEDLPASPPAAAPGKPDGPAPSGPASGEAPPATA